MARTTTYDRIKRGADGVVAVVALVLLSALLAVLVLQVGQYGRHDRGQVKGAHAPRLVVRVRGARA